MEPPTPRLHRGAVCPGHQAPWSSGCKRPSQDRWRPAPSPRELCCRAAGGRGPLAEVRPCQRRDLRTRGVWRLGHQRPACGRRGRCWSAEPGRSKPGCRACGCSSSRSHRPSAMDRKAGTDHCVEKGLPAGAYGSFGSNIALRLLEGVAVDGHREGRVGLALRAAAWPESFHSRKNAFLPSLCRRGGRTCSLTSSSALGTSSVEKRSGKTGARASDEARHRSNPRDQRRGCLS